MEKIPKATFVQAYMLTKQMKGYRKYLGTSAVDAFRSTTLDRLHRGSLKSNFRKYAKNHR